MDKQQLIDFIFSKIKDVLAEIINNNKNSDVDFNSKLLFVNEKISTGNHTIIKINTIENLKKLRQIFEKIIFEKEISNKYSEKYIYNIFIDLLHELQDIINLNDAIILEKLECFITELFNSKTEEYIVISKLENIIISEDIECNLLDSVIKKFHKEELLLSTNFFESKINEMNNKPIILTKVSAIDNDKIKELALINFETTFNFIKLIYPNFDVKLDGTMLSGRRDFFIIKNISKKCISSNMECMGDSRVNEARFNLSICDALSQLKFGELSKSQQKYLKECLYWYGQGLKIENISSKIINFVTILESLLKLKEEKVELSKSISERGAVMLNEKFEFRKIIKNELKEIYKIRSDIVHTGALNDNKNISAMAGSYARNVMLNYIKLAQKYKTHEELIEYLDNLKLGLKEDEEIYN